MSVCCFSDCFLAVSLLLPSSSFIWYKSQFNKVMSVYCLLPLPRFTLIICCFSIHDKMEEIVFGLGSFHFIPSYHPTPCAFCGRDVRCCPRRIKSLLPSFI